MLSSRLDYAKQMLEKLTQLIDAEEEEQDEETEDKFMMIDEKGQLNAIDIEEIKDKAAESVTNKMHEANISLKQLFFLGLEDESLINKGLCSAADVLQFILETKLALQPGDKDMIVMMHEIEYEIPAPGLPAPNKKYKVISSLVVKGEDNVHTAMAKTVGLPLGIAARLILEDKIKETGLRIPVIPSIYNPVLEELKKQGIFFREYLYIIK
jgi:hypothetical protein